MDDLYWVEVFWRRGGSVVLTPYALRNKTDADFRRLWVQALYLARDIECDHVDVYEGDKFLYSIEQKKLTDDI